MARLQSLAPSCSCSRAIFCQDTGRGIEWREVAGPSGAHDLRDRNPRVTVTCWILCRTRKFLPSDRFPTIVCTVCRWAEPAESLLLSVSIWTLSVSSNWSIAGTHDAFTVAFGFICTTVQHRLAMALLDLNRLVFLYKLRREDAGYLPTRSDFPPMASTPSNSAILNLAEHLKTVFETPKSQKTLSGAAGFSTPISRGSAARKRQEAFWDQAQRYKRKDYDQYIREDLFSRVFIDFDVFLKSVLHAPDDWKTKWERAITEVKKNKKFLESYNAYCEECNRCGGHEVEFYKPLIDTANAVLDVISDSKVGAPHYYHRSDPKHIKGGIMDFAGLCPDVVVLHRDYDSSQRGNLHWANPLHVLEVKPSDAAICDGENIPRLMVDGKQPTSTFRA